MVGPWKDAEWHSNLCCVLLPSALWSNQPTLPFPWDTYALQIPVGKVVHQPSRAAPDAENSQNHGSYRS